MIKKLILLLMLSFISLTLVDFEVPKQPKMHNKIIIEQFIKQFYKQF